MKKVFKKNRLVILALSVMIGVAGYLNFNESNKKNLTTKEDSKKADMEVISYEENTKADSEADLASSDDISKPTEEVATDKSLEQAAIEENIQLNSDEENIGEAVLTNAEVVNNSLAMIQLNREQSRSRTKEYLLSIINDDAIEESAKQEATAAYVKLSDNIEKETDAETLLAGKGL